MEYRCIFIRTHNTIVEIQVDKIRRFLSDLGSNKVFPQMFCYEAKSTQ